MSTRLTTHCRLLDLCCGGGLAAWGYWRSGCFSEIVGVDIADMSRPYPFDFIQADAFTLDYEFLSDFDFIHISPPCQGYSSLTPDQSKHDRLIPAALLMCVASGLPHVVENVRGSTRDLGPNLVINGNYAALPMERRRYFRVSTLRAARRLIKRSAASHVSPHSGLLTRSQLIDAFGLTDFPVRKLRFLTERHILEGVPPAFTTLIAGLVLTKYRIG